MLRAVASRWCVFASFRIVRANDRSACWCRQSRSRHARVRTVLHRVESDRAVCEDVQGRSRPELHRGPPADGDPGRAGLTAAGAARHPHRPLRRAHRLQSAAGVLGAPRGALRVRAPLLGTTLRRLPARDRRRVVRGRGAVRRRLVRARAAGVRARRLRDREHRQGDRVLRRAVGLESLGTGNRRLGDRYSAARRCRAVLPRGCPGARRVLPVRRRARGRPDSADPSAPACSPTPACCCVDGPHRQTVAAASLWGRLRADPAVRHASVLEERPQLRARRGAEDAVGVRIQNRLLL